MPSASSKQSLLKILEATDQMGNSQSSGDRFGTLDRRTLSFSTNPITNLEIISMVLVIIVVGVAFCLYKERVSSHRSPHFGDPGFINSNDEKRQIRSAFQRWFSAAEFSS